jgi:hypothetical protein
MGGDGPVGQAPFLPKIPPIILDHHLRAAVRAISFGKAMHLLQKMLHVPDHASPSGAPLVQPLPSRLEMLPGQFIPASESAMPEKQSQASDMTELGAKRWHGIAAAPHPIR